MFQLPAANNVSTYADSHDTEVSPACARGTVLLIRPSPEEIATNICVLLTHSFIVTSCRQRLVCCSRHDGRWW